jgi:hypothetical protein
MKPQIAIPLGVGGVWAGIGTAIASYNGWFAGHPSLAYWFWSAAIVLIAISLIGGIKNAKHEAGKQKAQAEQGKPRFAVEVLNVDLHVYTRNDFFFWITNCGARSARQVTFDPVRSKTAKYAIRFGTQPILGPYKRTPLAFRCGGDDNLDIDGNAGRLLLFFEDNPKKESTLLYDITVRFLDGDTALEEHHTLQAKFASGGAGAHLKIYPALAAPV